MSDQPKPMPAFQVAEVVVTSLEALISAAALHLGDRMPDGRGLTTGQQDPVEAWFALLGAGALVDQLGPLMQAEIRDGYRSRIEGLVDRLAKGYPTKKFPAPAPVVSSLKGLVEAAWGPEGK